jgi:hypothetical protein
MNSSTFLYLIFSFMMLLVSCTATTTQSPTNGQADDYRIAQEALAAFLTDLNEGRYEGAARLYGGSYDTMITQNPDIDSANHPALLQNACKINGYQCLEVKRIELDQVVSPTEYTFSVEFMNDDGTLFILGPCCGGNETDSPPKSSFVFKVIKDKQDNFMVIDMPPYMP